ncbi:hypothetical protein NM208_g17032 [Fusarium decemcellulare]|uniref:Uncharacterized protein n=1 Tax=Fusarium decemcellulare TaxID=57161 RepID=A0ACC1RCM4_9HYPO|nr:hypothetical protein NM208_g17032 [Fusarium decemcellulare]
MADDDFARAWNVDVHPFPKERWRDAKHWCILDVIDVEKAGNTKTRLKMPLNKFQDRRYNIELGLDALTSLGLVEDDTGKYIQLLKPTPASQGPSVDLNAASFHLDVWGQCVAPTSPALEERNPQRNLSLAIPEIKIDPSPLCLPSPSYGSTSAEDDGSNWDMYSMVSQSFQDDERIWSPSVSESIDRISQIGGQISGNPTAGGRDKILEKNPDDIVVTACCRSAFTKGGRGGFKDTQAADILAGVLKAIIDRSKINPALVEDLCVGTVLAPGGGATEMRAASLVAGFPESIAVRTLNRQCSSGLQACVDVANQIKTGMIDVGIGAGVESMSLQYGPGAVTEFSELLENHPEAANCKVPMGVFCQGPERRSL